MTTAKIPPQEKPASLPRPTNVNWERVEEIAGPEAKWQGRANAVTKAKEKQPATGTR